MFVRFNQRDDRIERDGPTGASAKRIEAQLTAAELVFAHADRGLDKGVDQRAPASRLDPSSPPRQTCDRRIPHRAQHRVRRSRSPPRATVSGVAARRQQGVADTAAGMTKRHTRSAPIRPYASRSAGSKKSADEQRALAKSSARVRAPGRARRGSLVGLSSRWPERRHAHLVARSGRGTMMRSLATILAAALAVRAPQVSISLRRRGCAAGRLGVTRRRSRVRLDGARLRAHRQRRAAGGGKRHARTAAAQRHAGARREPERCRATGFSIWSRPARG